MGRVELDESGDRHWLVRTIWGVLVVVAFVLLNFVVPAGQEVWDQEINDHEYDYCEYNVNPGCPGYPYPDY